MSQSKFVAPRTVDNLQQVSKALRDVQESLDLLSRSSYQLGLQTSDFAPFSPSYNRVSPPVGGMRVVLPRPSNENGGQPITFAIENPQGTLTVFASNGTKVNGAATATLSAPGIVTFISNGVDQWASTAQLPGPAGAVVVSGPGPRGIDGSDGADGQDGAAGAPGVAGADGAAGVPGVAGARGFDGFDGQDGDTVWLPAPAQPGTPGPAGATGATGGQGTAGLPGDDGQDGETIWLPAPGGPPGSTGATGADGMAGGRGMDGFDGSDGDVLWLPAPPGAQGVQGIQGPIGTQGPGGVGFAGEDGSDADVLWLPAPAGLPGAAGATGSQGLAGLGLQGDPGADGDVIFLPGAPGATGATGATGASGAKTFQTVSETAAGPFNDYAIPDCTTVDYLHVASTATSTYTGFAASGGNSNGERFVLISGSTSTTTISHQSASSVAANRVACPRNVDMVLGPRESVEFEYLSPSWRIVSGPQLPAYTTTAPVSIASSGGSLSLTSNTSLVESIGTLWQVTAGSGAILTTTAGAIRMTPATSLNVTGAPFVKIDESAASTPAVGAGAGMFWTKNTAPSSAAYTDDTEVDKAIVCAETTGIGDTLVNDGNIWHSYADSHITTASATVVSASTTPTNIISLTIPANTLVIGGAYELYCCGSADRSATAGVAVNVTLTILIGASPFAVTTRSMPALTSQSHRFIVNALFKCSAIGAGGSLNVGFSCLDEIAALGTTVPTIGRGTQAISTAASIVLALQVGFGAAVAGTSVSVYDAHIRRVS